MQAPPEIPPMNLPDTRAARRSILGALRAAAPAQGLPRPDLAPYWSGPYGRGCEGERPDPATLVAGFEAAARGWRADVRHAGPADWPQALRAALDTRGCRRIALGTASELSPSLDEALADLALWRFDQPLERCKAELFDTIDAGITSAQAGIADTGTLLLIPGPGEPRSLSLVPPVHVAVLPVSRLYAGLPAAMRALQPEANMPTNLLLVTGPSKTSDIQQTLAFGAHGPKELVIVLVHDEHHDAAQQGSAP
jgi:L-lactate dehydrogenase complex protein LldG